jgi:hypothetical protein
VSSGAASGTTPLREIPQIVWTSLSLCLFFVVGLLAFSFAPLNQGKGLVGQKYTFSLQTKSHDATFQSNHSGVFLVTFARVDGNTNVWKILILVAGRRSCSRGRGSGSSRRRGSRCASCNQRQQSDGHNFVVDGPEGGEEGEGGEFMVS